jgi:hypothetical protein
MVGTAAGFRNPQNPTEWPNRRMISGDKSAQPIESTRSAEINPYSPAPEIKTGDDAPSERVSAGDKPDYPTLQMTILRWTVMCSVAAAPSFFLGLTITRGRAGGMVASILTFIGLYVAADLITRHWPIRRNRVVRRTLVIVYFSRIAASILFPIGTFVDMMTGILMAQLVGDFMAPFRDASPTLQGETMLFWLSYRLTFIQATLMHVVLVAWGILCLPFIAAYYRNR